MIDGSYTMKDVYINCPIFENSTFYLRLISQDDCADLLKVYSNNHSQLLFNSDNCHGDNFHYTTHEMMKKAIDFWIYSYNYRWFVRWSIIDKLSKEVIGTIELFHRDSSDTFNDCGLLRLDLRYDYENISSILSILNLITHPTYEFFNCNMIATKGFVNSPERNDALIKLGFYKSELPLIANDIEYHNYWIRKK